LAVGGLLGALKKPTAYTVGFSKGIKRREIEKKKAY